MEDQLGLVLGMASKIADGSDTGTSLGHVTTVAELHCLPSTSLQLILQIATFGAIIARRTKAADSMTSAFSLSFPRDRMIAYPLRNHLGYPPHVLSSLVDFCRAR